MKAFFLLIVFSLSLHSISQQPRAKIDTVRWFGNTPQDSLQWLTLNPVPAFPQAKLSHVLPNGNKVYRLPQDNMPCVVPDTTMYYKMPVMKGRIAGMIPNASPPTLIIPKKKQ